MCPSKNLGSEGIICVKRLRTLSSNKNFIIYVKNANNIFYLTLTKSICHSQAEIILLDGPFNYFVSFLPFSKPNVPNLSSNIELSLFKSFPDKKNCDVCR